MAEIRYVAAVEGGKTLPSRRLSGPLIPFFAVHADPNETHNPTGSRYSGVGRAFGMSISIAAKIGGGGELRGVLRDHQDRRRLAPSTVSIF